MEKYDNSTNSNPLDCEEKKTDIITLRQLLSGQHVFRVPDYQRGYAWNNEFRVLWQDIMRLHKTTNRKHYTGMLALEEITDNHIKNEEIIPNTTAFYIVDGQQRITSLIIILKALMDYIKEELPDKDLTEYNDLLETNNMIKRFGYSSKRIDGANQFFEGRIFGNNTGLPHADMYLSNINAAKEYIDKELNRVSGDTALDILNELLTRIVFNLYFVATKDEDDFDVRVTFETINNRGKRLSKLELLKNRLMYLSTFFPQNSGFGLQLKSEINNAWNKIYSSLCFGDEQLSDDEYLKAHWIVYGRLNKRKGDAYINDLLEDEFSADKGKFFEEISNGNYIGAYQHIKKYIESLSKYSLYWAFVNKPDDVRLNIEANESNLIKRLSRISSALFLRAALMVVVAENGCGLLADKKKYYSKLELFIFTNKLLAQDSNDLSFLVTSVKRFIESENPQNIAFQQMIDDIDRHDLHVDAHRIVKAVEAFKLNVLEKKQNYYYDWNGLSYFLYEYNESLNIPNAAAIEWYKLSSTSIEHVYPQTPQSEYWQKAFGNYTEDKRKIIVNSLGNLLLLSCGAENSSLKNYSFPVKKEMPVGAARFSYKDGSRSAREIAEQECWTINEISNRNDKLINFMYEHWFSEILSRTDWKQCENNLKNNLPSKLNDTDYSNLKSELLNIDTTNERNQACRAAESKSTNYLQQKFLEFIDTSSIKIKYNRHNTSHTERFTFTIKSHNNETPIQLKCGVRIDEHNYDIIYKYSENKIELYKDNDRETPILESGIPDKLKMFISSLYRYLRKAYEKDKPTWVSHV